MRLFLLCISLLSLVSARAQHHHFLYIQSEPQQPFYVKMGSNVMSSSVEGFLIIPRLRDSAYEMVIGFPAKKFPEYRFLFSGFRKDRGMALKNFGDKGWGLFDYQTLEIMMGEKIPEKEEPKAVTPAPLTNDAFTVVLASVIDDPGLLATPLVLLSTPEAAPIPQPVVRRETGAEPVMAAKPKPAETARTMVPPTEGKAISAETARTMVPPTEGKAISAETGRTMVPQPAEKASPKDTAGGGQSAPSMTKVATDPPKDNPPVVAPAKPSPPKEILVPAAVTPVATNEVNRTSLVRRIQEKAVPEGLEITYLDQPLSGVGDTVQVLIPYAPSVPAVVVQAAKDTLLSKPVVASKEPAVERSPVNAPKTAVEPPVNKSTAIVDTQAGKGEEPPVKKSTAIVDTQAGKAPVKEERVVVDSPAVNMLPPPEKPAGPANRENCARMATDKDLAAVRKKIVGIKDEDEMVLAALKDFKQRCYTTEQVKTISYIFTREEGKYKLIDAAYPYVYDPSNYGQLEALLKDRYFIYRFKALINR